MRRVIIGLLLFVLLLGGAAWAVPRLLDWERWRVPLAELATARLGRTVSLDGPITLTLLPQPRLEAGQVTLGPGADGVSVAARALRLRLGLGALLAGRLEARELALVGGEIRLPWPPATLPSLFFVPNWFTALDARLEDCRLLLGGLQLEGLNASLTSGGVTEALAAAGSFTWRGQAVRFTGQLGRAGFDNVAPLDLSLAAGAASLTARGSLASGGGFTGRVEAAGPDLAQLLPVPPGAFRATGRLTAAADLLAADELALDLGGQAARGAVALRLAPEVRVDLALAAGRLDLDAWVAALRQPRGFALPLSVDLSAEATSFAGVPLRRLRGAAFLGAERLTLSDVSALLPGDTEVQLDGATAGGRIELGIRFSGNAVRETVAALGLPLAGTDPARLRRGEGRFRVALEGGQATISDLVASIDGARLSGAGALRLAANGQARPSLGLGITLDRLDLDGLLPVAPDWGAMLARPPGFDLNLRLAAEQVRWRGTVAERLALDAALEGNRLALRRLALHWAGLDATASGGAQLGQAPRFSDLSLELAGGSGAGLAGLVPAAWLPRDALDGAAVALRLTGAGAPDALALRAEGDLGELRLEANAALDVPQRRGNGRLTLRHPGAPRLLRPLLGAENLGWLGEGSFSLIATLAGGAESITAEHLDLVAGALRGRGKLTLAAGAARPRLSGQFAAELLPLPGPGWPANQPLPLERLLALDADLRLEARRAEPVDAPVLADLATRLRLEAGTLRLEALRAGLAGGQLEAEVTLEGAAQPPRLAVQGKLSGASLAEPLFDLPLDIGPGLLGVEGRLVATGHTPAGLLASLEGEVALNLRDGVLRGLDLPAAQAAAGLADQRAAEAALRQALAGGATALERLALAARLERGRLLLGETQLVAEGAGGSMSGEIDLPRRSLDLRIATRPVAEAPEIALRLQGPAATPRRLPELAPFLRWRAERG